MLGWMVWWGIEGVEKVGEMVYRSFIECIQKKKQEKEWKILKKNQLSLIFWHHWLVFKLKYNLSFRIETQHVKH